MKWEVKLLGDVVDILDSRRIPVNSKERATRVGDVPYYGATGHVGFIDKHLFDEELVLLGEDGAPFLDSHKPKAYLISGKSWVNNHAHVLRGKPELLNRFLLHQLNALDYRPFVSGTTRLKLPQGPMKQIPLVVPSKDDQQRIVAEIEKQFTRLEAGLAGLRRVQANLKRYRAAVLKSACEGTLTDTDAKSWKRAKLGDVLTAIEAGKSFRCEERPPSETEVGIVKVSAVTWGSYDERESKTCLDSTRVEERFLVQQGDFLFSRANTIELVGACVIAKQVSLRVMLSDKILRFRFSRDVLPEWVLYWLRSLVGRHEIERLATGNQMSMRNIGQERIRQIQLLIPPIAEQSLIVSEVERRLSIVDELEAVVTTNIQRANRLRQSILQQAFKGELIS